ncbi:unannotated protein [freshwater metagenome]|uniref:Unannotated protein n=1 Tax=freshwater metagenome TaxID=449393 RepID=A0A6J7D5X6_9ZZZZ
MQILDLHAHPSQIVSEILGHLLRERRDENPLVLYDSLANALEHIVDLTLGWLDDDLRVDETRRTDDLFDDAVDDPHFVLAWCRRQIHLLAHSVQEFWPLEWSVVQRAGKAETVFDEGSLPRRVTFVHCTDLWDRHVGFIDDDHKIVGEIVDESV